MAKLNKPKACSRLIYGNVFIPMSLLPHLVQLYLRNVEPSADGMTLTKTNILLYSVTKYQAFVFKCIDNCITNGID